MIIGENTQIEGRLEIWTSASISMVGVGSFQSLEVSPTGLKFPNDAFGGSGDTAGIRLVTRGTENQSLEIYTTNDTNGDWVNLVVPSVNDAKVNGNTIWNAGNFNPANKSDVGHTHSILNITDRASQYIDDNYDVGVAQMLRWKNYGDGHEIIDASQGLSPNGITISNTNPDVPWSPSYPTLVGWNGTSTYGVRVDRSRYSDNSDALGGVALERFIYGANGSGTNYVVGPLSAIAKSGFYNNNTSVDSPVPSTWVHLIHSDYTADDSWAWQLAANFEAANAEDYYTRIKVNGQYKDWRKIWTTKDISQTMVNNWNSTYSSVNSTSANWNTAYNKVITSRIAEGVYNANDSLTMAQRNSFGVSFGRIFSSTTATDTPELNHYFSYVLMPETPGANSQTSLAISNTNHSSYVGRGGWNSVMDWDRIWTDYDFTQININNWNTAYSSLGNYLPLSGGTLTGDLQILAGSTGWGEGIRVVAPAGSWGGLRLTRANDTISRDGNWSIGYANNSTGDLEFHNYYNGNQHICAKFLNAGGVDISETLTANKIITTNNGNGENFRVGDDAWIGDVNVANTIWVKGITLPGQGYVGFGSDSNKLGYTGSFLSYSGMVKFGPGSHPEVPGNYQPFVFDVTNAGGWGNIVVANNSPSYTAGITLKTTSNTNSTWGIQKRDDGLYGTSFGCFAIEDSTGSSDQRRFPIVIDYGDSGFIRLSRPVTLTDGKQLTVFKNVDPSVGNDPWTEAPILITRTSTSTVDFSNVAGLGFHNQGVNASLFYYDPSSSQFKYRRSGGGTTQTFWDSGNFDPSTKQNSISKTVFEAAWGNGAATAGWCKLGTYAGNSTSRFTFIITGKAGWNDQNFASQAIIHGGTNYIVSDVGQIAAGCKWNEFAGSSETASQIRLVRQSGYNPHTFDLYVLNDSTYVCWVVEVTHPTCSWTTGIAWQQVDPGTGTNIFQPTKRTVWETSNFDPSTKSDTSHSHNVKDLAWSTNQADGILNNPTNGITDSPDNTDGLFTSWAYHFKMLHSANPADWQFLLAADFYNDSIGFRRKANGSWQAPQYLWHSGNFSQTNINNWNTAYTNNHTHTNKANIDLINQSLNTSATPSFNQIHVTNNGNGENFRVGDDAWIGDVNAPNTIWIKGAQTPSHGFIGFGSDSTSLGFNGASLSYGGRFDVTQLRAGASTFCVVASTTNSDIWNDQGGSYSIHISNGQGFNFYQGTPGARTPIAGINSNGTINSQSLTTSRVVVSDTSKNLISSNITTTELGHLAGTSANIQTQINQLASASISGVGAGTVNRVSKFTTGTGIGDSNINDDGSTISFLTHITGSTGAFTGGLNVGVDGIRFPDNAYGGGGDTAGIRLISKGGEAQSMELYVGNDIDDWVNLVGPDNNFAKVNGNTIWNAGNLTQANINNWNTAYTSAHFHNNRTYLDSINQNLGTASNATFGDVTTTGSVFSRFGYFGTHSGWVDGTYALRVYGDTLLGHTSLVTNYQFNVTKNITPTTASNTNYAKAPIVINRATQDSSTTTVAGIGFHNAGVNAATLYYDAVTSVFKYNREVAGPLITIWDDSNFTPGNYLPKSGSFGGSDGYIFEIESGSDSGGLSLRLTDNSDGTEYFVVRNNAGDPSLIANSDRTVNIGYQNYQQVKPILSIGDQQYGIGANSGYLDLYSAGGGFRAFSKSGSSDAVFVGNFWHSGNFNPNNYSLSGHTHQFVVGDRTAPNSSVAPSSWWGDGLYMARVYGQDYPTSFGNVLSMDGLGRNQLFLGWSGGNAGNEGMWFRNKRYSFDGWSSWQRAIDTVSDATSISNWNTAYTRVATSRIGGYVFSNNDSVELKDRTSNGTSFGRIHNVLGSPGYFNFLMMPEDPSTNYGVIGHSADDNWYVARAGMGANPTNYYKIWSTKDISQTNVDNWNTVYNNSSSYSTTAHSHNVKDLSWSTERYDDILNHNKNGITDSPTGADGIFGNWAYHLKMIYSSDTNWQFLLAADFYNDSIGFKRKENGTWKDARYLWHSGNFNKEDYLQLTGGTMTGNIVFSDADEGVEFRRGAKVGNIGSYLTFRMEQDNNNPRLLSNNGATSWTVLTTRNVTTTTNYIPRFVGTGGLNEIQMQNSLISDDGTNVTINGAVSASGQINSNLGFRTTGYGVQSWIGPGLELHYTTATNRSRILSFNRTSTLYEDLEIRSKNLVLSTQAGTSAFIVDASGDVRIKEQMIFDTFNKPAILFPWASERNGDVFIDFYGLMVKNYHLGGGAGYSYSTTRIVDSSPNGEQLTSNVGFEINTHNVTTASTPSPTISFGQLWSGGPGLNDASGLIVTTGSFEIQNINAISHKPTPLLTASTILNADITYYTISASANRNITLPSIPRTNTIYYLNVIDETYQYTLVIPSNHYIFFRDLTNASVSYGSGTFAPKLKAGLHLLSCYFNGTNYLWTLDGQHAVV